MNLINTDFKNSELKQIILNRISDLLDQNWPEDFDRLIVESAFRFQKKNTHIHTAGLTKVFELLGSVEGDPRE